MTSRGYVGTRQLTRSFQAPEGGVETISYATRRLGAGVSLELHVLRGATHCLDLLAPNSAIARRTRQEYHQALRVALTKEEKP